MNTDLRKKATNDFEKDLMNNGEFGKTTKNVRKLRNINFATTEGRNYLMSEPNHRTAKFFTENILGIEMRKIGILMNKPVFLGLSILELSKILMHEFWYGHVKPKYGKKAKSFIVCIKIDDIFKDIARDVETRLDTSSYKLVNQIDHCLKEKIKKSNWINER